MSVWQVGFGPYKDDTSNIVSNLVLDIISPREGVFNDSQEITDSLAKFWKHESMGLLEESAAMIDKQDK